MIYSPSIRLFADDCVVYQTISDEDITVLQSDVNEISRDVPDGILTLISEIHRCRSPLINNYILNSQIIKSNNAYKYLGVLLSHGHPIEC